MKDIKNHFNASRHPAVHHGEKSEAQVTLDFNSMLSAHHEASVTSPEEPVSREEFFDLFRFISFNYQIDEQFTRMLTGVWNIDVKDLNQANAGKTS